MTNEIWTAVWQSLVMGFAFLIPFALCRFADIAFGVYGSIKIESLSFNWKKFLAGVLSTFIVLVGLAALIAGITMIPQLLAYYEVDFVDTEVVGEMINVIMIISTIVVAGLTYGRDAYNKFKTIIHPASQGFITERGVDGNE